MSSLCHQRSLDDLIARLYPPDLRRLSTVSVELTRRCNLACRHCYCCLPEAGPPPRPELATSQWRDLISQAAEAGALFALFTGGEPLLRPDFRELWQFARQQGLIAVLFTNGALVDEDLADFLARWTPRQVSVTLYGATEGTYRRITGVEGMHRRVLQSVDLLKSRGLDVQVRSVITRSNMHEFEALRAQSARYQDTFQWDAELIAPYPIGGGDSVGERLTAEELLAVEALDAVRAAEWRDIATNWQPAPPRPDSPFRCRVGHQDAHIDPYGIMHPCLGLEKVGLDLMQMSLREAWERLPGAIREVIAPAGPCQSCPLPPICRQCPADNLLEGVPTGQPLPWRCETARLRAQELDLPATAPCGLWP